MPGINSEVICHKLSIKADNKPVKQKPRRMNEEWSHAISDEVEHLLRAGFIREKFYPDWLSNPVLVKKKNGKRRVCIDFINLNEAYPKDSYPLSRIDQLVEATAGHELLNFIDAYSGYNQHGSKSRSRPPTRQAPRRIGLKVLDQIRVICTKRYVEN